MGHKRAVVVVLWVMSLLGVGAFAQQTVPRSLTPPQSTLTVIGAPDVAFRVESWEGSVPVGRWVVRHPITGNQWVEPKVAAGVRTLTAR